MGDVLFVKRTYGKGVSAIKMRNDCRLLRILKVNPPYNEHFGWFCNVLIIN